MQQNDRFTVINICEYLKNDGDADQLCEDELKQILAEFSCSKNQDVEYFLKTQAIDFYLSTEEYRKKKTWNRMNLYSF